MLRQIVGTVDPAALVIAQGHVAYGEGFLRSKSRLDDASRAAKLKRYLDDIEPD